MNALVSRLPSLMPVTLAALLILGIADSAFLAAQYWLPGRMFDVNTSGVWTALAFDFSQGHLYRPLVSDIGYGGTRYMPLFFMFHGSIMRLGLDPIAAGIMAMQASLIAMLCGIYLVLRRTGASRALAAALALVTLCTTIFQQYVTDVNCDYLAAAFGLFALTAYLQVDGKHDQKAGIVVAALFSVLAFCTKFSSIYVPAAILLHLVFVKRWHTALLFVMSGLLFAALLVGVLGFASDGLMWNNISQTATGETSMSFAIMFPLRFIRELFYYNPSAGVLFGMGVAGWALDARRRPIGPVSLTFVMVSLATLVTYASVGISGNHIIPLQAFSIVMIGSTLSDPRMKAVSCCGFVILTLLLIATWLPGVPSPRKSLDLSNTPTRVELIKAIADSRAGSGPLLSDNPTIPVMLGERPYLLDKFNFDHFSRSHPSNADQLQWHLANRHFSLLVLSEEFDEAVMKTLNNNYAAAQKVGSFTIFKPR